MANVMIDILVEGQQAQREAEKVSDKLDDIGQSGQRGANKASASLRGYEKAIQGAGSQAENLLLKHNRLQQEINRLNTAIKAESQSLDLMQRVAARSADAQGLLADKITGSEKSLGTLLVQKRAVNQELGALQKQLDGAGGGFSRITQQVRTSGTIFEGLDPLLTAIVGSLGGISVGGAVAFSVIGALLIPLKEWLFTTREQIQLNKEALALQAERLRLLETEGGHVRFLTENTLAQIRAQRQVFDAIFLSAIQAVIDKQNKLEAKQREINESQNQGLARLATLGAEYGKLRGELTPLVEVIEKYQHVTGASANDVISHARALGKWSGETDVLRRALVLVNPAIDEMGNKIGRVTLQIRGATQATRDFNQALRELKLPGPNVGITEIGRAETRGQLESVIAQQMGDKRSEVERFQSNLPAIQAFVDGTKQGIEAEARMRGERLKSTEVNRRATEEIARNTSAVNLASQEVTAHAIALINSEKANDRAAGGHSRAAAAARSYATELNNLSRRLQEAEFALLPNTIERQEAVIRAQIDTERQRLEINKKDRAAALELLSRIEAAQIEKVNRDRLAAVHQVEDEITRLNIGNITDERSRRLALIDFELTQKRRALLQAFGDEKLVNGLIDQYERARIIEFNEWQKEQNRKLQDDLLKASLDAYQRLTEEVQPLLDRLAETFSKRLVGEDKAGLRTRRLFDLGEQFRTGLGVPDIRVLDQAVSLMDKLGVSADQVANAFGFAAANEKVFLLQLKALEKFDSGDFAGGFIDSLKAVGLQLVVTGQLFQQFGQFVSGVFEGLVTGSLNAKAAFLQFLAEILTTVGQTAIAIGTVYLFLPGHAGLGAALIAAGVAALALAGVFGGLAANARKAEEAGGAGSAAASSRTGVVGGRRERPPIIIPINNISPRNQPVTVSIQLDRQGVTDLLEGREVVTIQGARGPQRRALKRALGVKTLRL